MIRTQIQLPDALYKEAKRVAGEREISFAEVVRRGIEYITRVYPPTKDEKGPWSHLRHTIWVAFWPRSKTGG